MLALHDRKRGTNAVLAIAHKRHASLYGNGIYLAEKRAYEGNKVKLCAASVCDRAWLGE